MSVTYAKPETQQGLRLMRGPWASIVSVVVFIIVWFVAAELATAHWYDISAARRDLEWEPRVSYDEGMERLRLWLRQNPQFLEGAEA